MHTCPLAELSATIATLPDRELLVEIERLATDEHQATTRLIAALGELDEGRLYRDAGCSSLFTYCTQALHLSEHAACRRIEAARASRRFPLILELAADGPAPASRHNGTTTGFAAIARPPAPLIDDRSGIGGGTGRTRTGPS